MTLNDFINNLKAKQMPISKIVVDAHPHGGRHEVSYFFGTEQRYSLVDFEGEIRGLAEEFEKTVINGAVSKREQKRTRTRIPSSVYPYKKKKSEEEPETHNVFETQEE